MMKNRLIYFVAVSLIAMFSSKDALSQNYIGDEEEMRIMMSEEYYAEYGYAMTVTDARARAVEALVNTIVSEAVSSAMTMDEMLREVEMNAHTGRVNNEGQACVLVWIHKDSVFVTVSRTLSRSEKNYNTVPETEISESLLACKNYSEFRRALVRSGYIYGDLNSTVGFPEPAQCCIAVFDENGDIVSLLGKGDAVRMNLLNGRTITNPVQIYEKQGYTLWYFLQTN